MSSALLKIVLFAVTFVVLGTVATLCHLGDTFAVQMVGSFCGLVALVMLCGHLARTYPFFRGRLPRKHGPPQDLARTASRVLPPFLVVAVAVAVLAPLLSGQMPLSHDHPVHLYKAWHFWEEMLLEGRLRGWSSYWFFGYPAEELYPIGPDIWVACFRVATLSLFSWETTYGLAFVGVFALAAYAVYSFGRRYFSAGAGFVAAMLWIFDRGDYREGGWSYTVDWAVWVQIMAMAFALLALGRLQDVLERRRPLDYALCGLLFAAALLSHPMNVIVFGLALPLLLLSRWLTGEISRTGSRFGREVAAVAGVVAIGVAVAGFWLLPMMARSGWTTSIGDLWRPLSQTTKGLLDGTVFANVWPLPVMLGVVGAGLGLAARRPVAIFLVLLAAVLLFAASSTAFNELSLMSISKAFSKIQYQRLVIPAKACFFLLAGFAVSEIWRRVMAVRSRVSPESVPEDGQDAPQGEHREEDQEDAAQDEQVEEQPEEEEDERRRSGGQRAQGRGEAPARALLRQEERSDAAESASAGPEARRKEPAGLAARLAPFSRRAGLVVLCAAAFSPFVRPAVKQLRETYLRTIGSLILKRNVHYYADYQRFLEWSAQKRATRKDFYRISYELDRHNHLMMGAPAFNRTPYYKVGYTPAKLFKHVTETTEDPLYRALSVAYIVSQRPLSRPKLKLETRFGGIWVYRFTDYRKERYTLTGPGTVEVKEFSEERIHLKLSGTGPGSRLKVHVANYPRWRARQGGEDLVISEAPVHGSTYPMLMEVRARDGDLVFEYVVRGVDAAGSLLSLLGVAAVVLLVLSGHRAGLARWLRGKVGWVGRPLTRYAGWAALAAAVLVAGLCAYRLARGGTGLPDSSLASMLATARVTQAGRPCTDRRRDRWFCSGRSWNYVGPTTNMFKGGFIPCIWAHPVDEGPLSITFPRVTLGRALTGHHGLADGAVDGFRGGAPVQLEVRINGESIQTLTRPNEKGWISFRIDTTRFAGREAELNLLVSTRSSGGRHYCFDMEIER